MATQLTLPELRRGLEMLSLSIQSAGLPRSEIDQRIKNLLFAEELPPTVATSEAAEVNNTLRRTVALAEMVFPKETVRFVRWPNRKAAPGVFIESSFNWIRAFRPYACRRDCAHAYPLIIKAHKWQAFEECVLTAFANPAFPTAGATLLAAPPTLLFAAILETLEIT